VTQHLRIDTIDTIDTVDDEGRGRAQRDGKDYAVRGALPGDTVDVVVERAFASGIVQGRAIARTIDGGLHAQRHCPHPSPCPGCPLEGVDVDFQQSWRHARVVRACADADLHVNVDAVRPGKSKRQKMKLSADDTGKLGLFIPHTHVLVDTTRCVHVDDTFAPVLLALRPVLRGAAVRGLVLRAFREGVVVVVVVDAVLPASVWSALRDVMHVGIAGVVERVADAAGSVNSLVSGRADRVWGAHSGTGLHDGVVAHVDAFCQADGALAGDLVNDVVAFVVDGGTGTVLDAYAGSGAFARVLKNRGVDVIAVEQAEVCRAALTAIGGITVVIDDMARAVGGLRHVDAMVLDPPKKGLANARSSLIDVGAQRVALVACDPDAGARDAHAFVEAGYALHAVVPYALFPGSIEVETVFFLERIP
jgi:23S rRNA (uracil1939-C5)-methyltransferase